MLLGSIIINALCSICVGLCTLKLIGKLSPDLFTIMHLVFMVGPCMMTTRMRTAGRLQWNLQPHTTQRTVFYRHTNIIGGDWVGR